MKNRIFGKFVSGIFWAIGFLAVVNAQETETHVPVLPQVKERSFQVDYSKGYLVKEIKPDVYVYWFNVKRSLTNFR